MSLRALLVASAAFLAASAAVWAQMATADRIQNPGFWPTQPSPARADFLGPAACARCHESHAQSQAGTSMAHTAMAPPDAPTLRDNPVLEFKSRTHTYVIKTSAGRSVYSVTAADGSSSSVPLTWAFGAGKVGQTYLYEGDGVFHEGRLSYFSGHGGDFTPARAIEAPKDLAEAMGRPIPDAEARRCFACHNTASTAADVFDTKRLIAGITCEACHGPGRKHVEALDQKKLGAALDAILNPAKLDPAASVDFCGACHATFWDVKLAGEQGIAALRSQPNRLQSSRCWGAGDARLTCVACHDPHVPLVREAASYDARCLGCHVQAAVSSPTPATPTKDHPGRACPVARESCVTCHMPKYEAPGMHHEFTDHRIRIVAAPR